MKACLVLGKCSCPVEVFRETVKLVIIAASSFSLLLLQRNFHFKSAWNTVMSTRGYVINFRIDRLRCESSTSPMVLIQHSAATPHGFHTRQIAPYVSHVATCHTVIRTVTYHVTGVYATLNPGLLLLTCTVPFAACFVLLSVLFRPCLPCTRIIIRNTGGRVLPC